MLRQMLGDAIDLIYPPRCIACENATETPQGLCGRCWRDTHFFTGSVCDICGVAVPTAADHPGRVICDSCTHAPPAWDKGRTAIAYEDVGRRVVLAFKHGDRLDMCGVLAQWMARSARSLHAEGAIIAPVPLHWRRLIRRKYNQSAELARAIAPEIGAEFVPDLLIRTRHTAPQSGTRDERHAAMRDAIKVAPKHNRMVKGRPVLIVDDVMTSGATLSACTEALRPCAPRTVMALALARVARDA